MLKVKGEILIERQIEQLLSAGIDDITVVVGYMKEKFFYLEEKYGVKIVINEDYYRYNNTSTLIRVIDQLKNTYICSSDNYFVKNVFEKYVYKQYYSSVYIKGKTEEFCIKYDNRGIINNVTIGGENEWCMLGHVFFSKRFSELFKEILLKEYDNIITREELWERLYMRYINELDMYIRKYDDNIIYEFDSLSDLRKFDPYYINNTDSRILKNIGKVLECTDKDVTNIDCINSGVTNKSFKFECKGKKYVYRHPSQNFDSYIKRESESFSMKTAKELGLDDTFIYIDQNEGWKVSYFIDNARTLDYHNMHEVDQALEMIRTLHGQKIQSEHDSDSWGRIQMLIEKISENGRNDFEDFNSLYILMNRLYKYTIRDCVEKRLCHGECYNSNILLNNDDKMYLIDWELSGNDDPAIDLGTFICYSDYLYDETVDVINRYLGYVADDNILRHYIAYIAIASYYWFVRDIYQESIGNEVGVKTYMWYKKSNEYAKKALEMYENR